MPFYNRKDIKERVASYQDRHSFWNILPQAIDQTLNNPVSKIPREVLAGVPEAVTSGVRTLGDAYGTALGEITGVNAEQDRISSKGSKDTADTIAILKKKVDDPKTSDAERKRINESIKTFQKADEEQLKTRAEELKSQREKTDPAKVLAASGQTAVDLATLGVGGSLARLPGVAAKTAETGIKVLKEPGIVQKAVETAGEGAKRAADIITNPKGIKQGAISGSALGATYGGLDPLVREGSNATPQDIIGGAAGGAAIGAGAGGLLGVLSSSLAKSRGIEPGVLDNIKVTELPFFQVTRNLTDDQQARLTAAIQRNPDLGVRALSMDTKDAEAFIKTIEKSVKVIEKDIAKNTPKAADLKIVPSATPEGSLVEPQAVTPAQTGNLDDLQAAASSGNPAEYLKAKEAVDPIDVAATKKYDVGYIEGKKIPMTQDEMLDKILDLNTIPKSERSISQQDSLTRLTSSLEEIQSRDKTMAAEVTPGEDIGSVSMDVPGNERAAKALRGGGERPAPETAARTLADTISEQRKGIDPALKIESVRDDVVEKLAGEVKDGKTRDFVKGLAKSAQDPVTYLSRRIGKEGADFGYGMAQGAKFKSNELELLRKPLKEIQKISKEAYGKSQAAKEIGGKRMIQALSDRENASQYLKTDQERKLYDRFVEIFDHFGKLREDAGLAVRTDYAPWMRMSTEADEPAWLADAMSAKGNMTNSEDLRSRFSKQRLSETMGEDVNTNISDMIFGYVNSQLNELSYMEPVIKFQDAQKSINAASRLNAVGMNEARNYMEKMIKDAIAPDPTSGGARAADMLRSNAYQNILRGNIKIGLQNYTQLFVANSDITQEARSLASTFTKEEKDDIMKDVAFGGKTVSGDTSTGGFPTERVTSASQKLDKIDPYMRSEAASVRIPYLQGYAQGLLNSPAYRNAIATGKSKAEALSIARADPDAKYLATRRGNIVVNNTTFGANSYARPEMLRSPKVLGSKTIGKALTMFMRFPIGMSQHLIEQLRIKDTRAIDMFRYGDPRGFELSEVRKNFGALQGIMKDNLKAGEQVTGIPDDVLREQVELINKNIETIDESLKGISNKSRAKSLALFGAAWAAVAAIQFTFDAGGSLLFDKDEPNIADSINESDPTVRSWVTGKNSKIGGLGSPLSPVNKYGQVTTRPILNLIPGAGFVNRLSGNAISEWIDDRVAGK